MLELEKYDAIIFDMDGTLLDTMPNHVKAWQLTAEHFQFPFDRNWLHSLGGMPSYKIAGEVNKRYGLSLDQQAVSSFKMETFSTLPFSGSPIMHTFEVFKLHQGKKPMAIGTGSQRDSALKLLNEAGVLEAFDCVVSATEITNHKPNPDTFLMAADKMGKQASRCVVFEDTKLGLQAAHAAGMDCYLVTESDFEFYPV
ncbi:beta-phosphoglucomutase family hydrolase [Vibrio sp. 10N]|uniref:beta-phosphoglucomutase family hydrolase n=1 Tax=Vibrio sp. 10N TaxID=3058938 RepID=UPI0028142277|nr:beta-phosphoglucomutase family hydrolase [Vibrio sp. 10N]